MDRKSFLKRLTLGLVGTAVAGPELFTKQENLPETEKVSEKLTVNNNQNYDGYTLQQVIKSLKNTGLLA